MTNDQYDSPWKDILELYLREFMEFFFPEAARDIDWNRRYEFLDKELSQVVRDAVLGKRLADKLVKVWRKDGEESWVLAHVELQGRHEVNLSKRIFTYNYRIFDLHDRPVASLVVLADDRYGWRPDHFGYSLWGCTIGITFPVVKLTDYRSRWTELEQSRNPFAIAVMAHLKTWETRHDPENRRKWKIHLTKQLYRIGYQKQDVINLYRFVDWMMQLPEEAEKAFWEEVQSFEEEKRMKYVTSVEKMGLKKGRMEGRMEGRMTLIQKLLKKRFGYVPTDLAKKMENSELDVLDRFGESILDFEDLKDAENWWNTQGKEGNA